MRAKRAAGVLVTGLAALALAACNPPASTDTAWRSGGVATTAAPAAPQKAKALAVAPGPGGSAYVAVATTTYPGPASDRRELTLRKLTASGWDLSFEAGGPLPQSLGVDGPVTILPAPDGTIYVSQTLAFYGILPAQRVWHVQADGHLVPGFASGGPLKNSAFDVRTAWPTTVDASSRLLVAIPNGSVVRYLPGGSPDPAFANPGGAHVLAATSTTVVRATGSDLSMVSDAGVFGPTFTVPGDGPVIAMVPTPAGQVIVQRGATLTRLTAAGAIDTGWGTGGSVTPTAAFPAGSSLGAAAAPPVVQSDGSAVLTWAATDGTGALVANLTRLTPAGGPDATFGTAGVLRLDRTANATPAGFGLQATGSLGRSGTGLVAGTTGPDGTGRVTRFDAAGLVDTSINATGSLALDVPTVGAINPSSAITLADGHAVVAMLTTGSKLVLAKFAPNGYRATSFGVQGVTAPVAVEAQTPPPVLRAMPDGKLLVATGNYSVNLTRYFATGGLDTSWGTGGTRSILTGGPIFGVQRFAVAPDGSIVVNGYNASGGPTLQRISPSGDVGNELVVPSGTPRANRIEALALDSKGRPVVVTTSGTYGDADMVTRISRLTAALAPDPTFNAGNPRQIATGTVSITDLDIASGDRPVVLVRPFGNPATFKVIRLTAAGRPDATFGSSGTTTLVATPTAPAGTSFSAVALAVDAQGRSVIAGGQLRNGAATAVVLRLGVDGKPDKGFDGEGYRGWPASAATQWNTVAIGPDGKITLSGQAGPHAAVTTRLAGG